MTRSETISPEAPAWLRERGLTTVKGLKRFRPASIAAMSSSTDTFRVDADNSEAGHSPDQVYVKRYRYRGWKARWRGFFRGVFFGRSRARLEFEFLQEMRRRGAPAVEPLIFVEDRRRRWLRFCALVTVGQPNAEPLDAYVSNHEADWTPAVRRRFICAIAEEIAKFHDVGILHEGLYWRNILVTETEGGGWMFAFLDPGRHCRLYSGPAPQRARLSDLSDFAASGSALERTTDFTRFMRSYCNALKSEEARKPFLKKVLSLATKKAGQEDHRITSAVAFAWLKQRIEQCSTGGSTARFESMDDFFATVGAADVRGAASRRWDIRFELSTPGQEGTRFVTVVIEPVGITVNQTRCDSPDLTIRSDVDVWLSIINGSPNSLEAIRSGRLELDGDTRPLAALAQCLT